MRLTAHELTWSVGNHTIVDRVSLDCPAGSVTGLIGPNGSGKSSLLHMLGGLRRPDGGRILVGDRDIRTLSGRQRAQQLALVEQESETTLPLTVRAVVELGRIPHRGRWGLTRDQARGAATVEQAMRLARVDQLADRSWSTLSGGERQRAHLARAIAQEPQVLLLDEPTNHLDLRHQIEFLTRVRALGRTTVAAMHDLELAAAFCDRLLVLDHGRVVAAGATAQVLTGELIGEVYRVDAGVAAHPEADRPHVHWRGLLEHAEARAVR